MRTAPTRPSVRPKWPWLLGLTLIAMAGTSSLAIAEDGVPDYEGEFFTDLTQKLSSREKVKISRTLRVGAQSSRIHPMLVVITEMSKYPKLPQTIDGFATQLAKSWEIGDHTTKKGVLILFSLGDRKFFVAKTKNVEQKDSDAIKNGMGNLVTKALKDGQIPRAMSLAAQAIAQNMPDHKRTAAAGHSGATPATAAPRKTVTRTTRTRRSTRSPYGYSRYGSRSSGRRTSSFGWMIGVGILILVVFMVLGSVGGGRRGYGGGMGGGYYGGGGGGGFFSGMLTGGMMGYMFGGRGGYGGYGGGYGGGGGDYEETTTTESWSEGGGGDFDSGGGFDDGGFDSFGGGDFDGGGSFGEW